MNSMQAIGRIVETIEDKSRVERFSSDGGWRTFPVSIFYPLQSEFLGQPHANLLSLYHPAEEQAIAAFSMLGVRKETLTTFSTSVVENAVQDGVRDVVEDAMENTVKRGNPWPVVILSPGFGIDRDLYIETITCIVQAGFIVVTVGVPYDGLCTVYPDGHVALQADRFPPDEVQIQMRVQDIQLVIEQLHVWNQGTQLRGMFDLNRIGVIGHSLGGTAVYNVAAEDHRVRCAILFDASLHLLGDEVLKVPVLNMRQEATSFSEYLEAIREGDDEDDITDRQIATRYIEKQNHLYENLPSTKSFVKVVGATHLSFSTVGHFVGEVPSDVRQTIQEATVRYLKENLNDEGSYSKFLRGADKPSNLREINGIGQTI